MARGELRIYLGSAPGVGKTYAMLDEGWRRKQRGTDVVVGYVETHARPHTIAQLRDLEIVPRARYEYRGAVLEEMDLDAVLARQPAVVLVDELAHTNAPGAKHEKRWQDVEAILAAGIDVISTVNIQHLESVNDLVEKITGVRQRETVPDVVVRQAQQVELVDMTPEALRRRMAHGNIYPAEKVDAALANYFRPGNLAALRELALLWVADRVDESLQAYLEAHGIADTWETRERIMVAVTGAPGGGALIRRAARIASRARAELIGVHVAPASGLRTDEGELERHRALVRELGGSYHEIVDDDAGRALVAFARAERATQIVLGASGRSRRQRLLHGDPVDAVLRQASDLDVHVIATGDAGAPPPAPSPRRRRGLRLSWTRRILAWAVGLGGALAVTVVLSQLVSVGLSTVFLAYLAMVVAAALLGGAVPGLTTALVAFLLENYFFVPPVHTFTVSEPENLVSLLGFLAFAGVTAWFVHRLALRSHEADRARAEAAALAKAAGAAAGDSDDFPALLDTLRTTFDLDGVTLLGRDGGAWLPIASSGKASAAPDDGDAYPVDADTYLVLAGGRLDTEDRKLIATFAFQAATALEARRLRADAAQLDALAQADALRTGLLRSVSHDLRTPLAGIKANVTTLLQTDVDWPAEERTQILEAIDEECDRLTRLVGNLLDASRLQAGAVSPEHFAVSLEDVVGAALASLPPTGDTQVVLELPPDLPLVETDPDLLERVVANVVANAVRHCPPHTPVRLSAGPVGDRVELLVVDRGVGLRPEQREEVLQPFQRLGDGTSDGVGLGLAVAHGFTELVGGELRFDDTPGGGLTVVISLPKAPA